MSSRYRGSSPPAMYTYDDEEPEFFGVELQRGICKMNRRQLEAYYMTEEGLTPESACRQAGRDFESQAPLHGPPGSQPGRGSPPNRGRPSGSMGGGSRNPRRDMYEADYPRAGPPRNGGRSSNSTGDGSRSSRPNIYEGDYLRGSASYSSARRGGYRGLAFDFEEVPPRQGSYGYSGTPPGPRRDPFYEDARSLCNPSPRQSHRQTGSCRDARPSYGPPPRSSSRREAFYDGPPLYSSRRGGGYSRSDAVYEDDDDDSEGSLYISD